VRRYVRRSLLSALAAAGILLPMTPATAQFPAESTIPQAKRAKRHIDKGPDGPAPRTKDGHPDFTGFWGYAGVTSDLARDYGVGEVPMTGLGERLFKERQANLGKDDPEARCLPTGVPRRDPYPTKMVQTPDLLIILFEGNIHSYRQIPLDGRPHPKDVNPTWYGDSIGHWEGEELVIDTIGFNGKTWLDMAGHPASDKLHVIERYSRPNLGTLRLHLTIEDPVMYKRPWDVTYDTPLEPGQDIIEYICQENERDVEHIVAGASK